MINIKLKNKKEGKMSEIAAISENQHKHTYVFEIKLYAYIGRRNQRTT